MGKLKVALSFFLHTPIRHWPALAIYLLGWVLFHVFGIRLFRKRILRFKQLAICADIQGLGGLVFLYEVMIKGVYDFGPALHDPNVKVIFDVGANCGSFALTRCARNDTVRVFCLEPHPNTFLRLQENIAVNSLEKRITPRHAAAAASSGRGVLQLKSDSSMGVMAAADSSQASPLKVEVEMVSLDDFAAQAQVRPDMLKIDVEGFEVEVLKGASACLGSARHVILEGHSDLLIQQCRAILDGVGFKTTVRGGLVFGSKV